MVQIECARLRLRPPRQTDLLDLHAIFSDPFAMAYGATEPHGSLDVTRKWLQSKIELDPACGEDFVLEYGGSVIGKAGFPAFPEIGFIIHRHYWGKGLAREALSCLLDRAFLHHGLPEVLAEVDPRNLVSLRLLARLGFCETGRQTNALKVGGAWCDTVYLSIGRSHWAVRRSEDR
jgi:[ribosomal protein S5]-alanine N-acetyltransferase